MMVPVEEPTVTITLLLLLQTPVAASVKVADEPRHIFDAPVTDPASGNGLTVKVCTAIVVPHELVTVYEIVVVPAEIPVTTPDVLIVAIAG